MRQAGKLLAPMIALCLFFTGCAKTGDAVQDELLLLRTSFLSAQSFSITAEITADYGTRVYAYTLAYTGTAETGEMEILAPESIAGLTIQFAQGEIYLGYDGILLETGDITGDGLTPVEALAMLLDQWQTGYISTSYEEEGQLVMETTVTESLYQRTWFDKATYAPLKTEIFSENYRIIACTYTAFSYT